MVLIGRRWLDLDGDLGRQELLAVQVDVSQVLAARRRWRRCLQGFAIQLRNVLDDMTCHTVNLCNKYSQILVSSGA